MAEPRRSLSTALTLTFGLALGWFGASHRPTIARSLGGDHAVEDSVATGPVTIEYNENTKVQASLDALYYLDWRGGRLLASVPTYRQTSAATQVLDGFVERDLIVDFKIDPEKPSPHFLMTVGALGAFGSGWAPLFVFESTTKQVAVYRVQSQTIGSKSRPKFDLIELKSFAALPPLPPKAN